MGAPTLCALRTALPAALHEPVLCTSLISLRSFAAAAEPCRVEDQQSAAEALFRVASDDQISEAHSRAPAVYPFFARAYYVGEREGVLSKIAISFMLVHVLTSACCRQFYQPGTIDKACQQTRLSYLRRQRHGFGMCCCRHKGQAVRESLRNGQYTANLHNGMTAIIAYQPSTTQAATLGINTVQQVLCLYCVIYVL